jgi:hypothetical protein
MRACMQGVRVQRGGARALPSSAPTASCSVRSRCGRARRPMSGGAAGRRGGSGQGLTSSRGGRTGRAGGWSSHGGSAERSSSHASSAWRCKAARAARRTALPLPTGTLDPLPHGIVHRRHPAAAAAAAAAGISQRRRGVPRPPLPTGAANPTTRWWANPSRARPRRRSSSGCTSQPRARAKAEAPRRRRRSRRSLAGACTSVSSTGALS